MANNSTSSEVSGPRKRKLSTKASTNGDPQVARKRQKSGKAVKESVTAALTKKRAPTTVPSKITTGTPKTTPAVSNQASAKAAPEKSARKRATVDIEEIVDDSDDHASNPPRNPKHILEAADGSDDDDDDPDPAPDLIPVDDDDDEEEEEETNLEVPEESAEAELGMSFIVYIKLN